MPRAAGPVTPADHPAKSGVGFPKPQAFAEQPARGHAIALTQDFAAGGLTRARKRARPAFVAAPGASVGWTIPERGGGFRKTPGAPSNRLGGHALLNRNNFGFEV